MDRMACSAYYVGERDCDHLPSHCYALEPQALSFTGYLEATAGLLEFNNSHIYEISTVTIEKDVHPACYNPSSPLRSMPSGKGQSASNFHLRQILFRI
jgi:hypothetical protein